MDAVPSGLVLLIVNLPLVSNGLVYLTQCSDIYCYYPGNEELMFYVPIYVNVVIHVA